MGHNPKKPCRNESFYGYDPQDVIRVGGPDGKRGPPGPKGDKGDKGDPGRDGTGGDAHYRYVQGLASSTWVIPHALNKYPAVTVVDSAGDQVEGAVTYDSQSQVTIRFKSAFSGEAFLN